MTLADPAVAGPTQPYHEAEGQPLVKARRIIERHGEEAQRRAGEAPKEAAELDQHGCMYEPHVLAMMTGQGYQEDGEAIAKSLSGHLPVLELVWARYLFYALALVPFALRRQPGALIRPKRPGLQLLRGGLMAFSAWMFFGAVARMPLADAMAVFFVYPFLIMIGSAFLLRESVSFLRWLMVIVGFIGTALVIRPASTFGVGRAIALRLPRKMPPMYSFSV